jgi:hypothetical protein
VSVVRRWASARAEFKSNSENKIVLVVLLISHFLEAHLQTREYIIYLSNKPLVNKDNNYSNSIQFKGPLLLICLLKIGILMIIVARGELTAKFLLGRILKVYYYISRANDTFLNIAMEAFSQSPSVAVVIDSLLHSRKS